MKSLLSLLDQLVEPSKSTGSISWEITAMKSILSQLDYIFSLSSPLNYKANQLEANVSNLGPELYMDIFSLASTHNTSNYKASG